MRSKPNSKNPNDKDYIGEGGPLLYKDYLIRDKPSYY